jgi:hypothetical protein
MGATGSRSSPATETLSIHEYTKLMRAPVRDHHRNWIRFRDVLWEITVTSMRRNEEATEADFLSVAFFLGVQYGPDLAIGVDISIEILDKTGRETVFQSESSRVTEREIPGLLFLQVRRSELEASSCVRRHDDSLFLRCTLTEQRRPPSRLQRSCWLDCSSNSKSESEVTAMARCHTLTVDSLSQITSALRLPDECAYSTRFAVGGSRWFLKLDPTLAVMRLVRATKEDDETRVTAELSFALEGAVSVQSGKMTHTFHRDSPDCVFAYHPPEEPSTSSTDQLHVRCCLKVIPPAAVPSRATTIPATVNTPVLSPAESALTPLLSGMSQSR